MTEPSRTLSEADDGSVVRLAPRESVELRLGEQATTGFRWILASPIEPILRLVDDALELAPGAGVGAGGTRRLRFVADRAGDADLRLTLSRAWEGPATAARRFNLRVEVR